MAIRTERGTVTKEIQIGNWNMQGAASLHTVPHGLSATEWKSIRRITVVIRDDSDGYYTDLTQFQLFLTGTPSACVHSWDATNISLARQIGNEFDNASYSTPPASNRGWITFEYTPD
jgi:hypothetical protein